MLFHPRFTRDWSERREETQYYVRWWSHTHPYIYYTHCIIIVILKLEYWAWREYSTGWGFFWELPCTLFYHNLLKMSKIAINFNFVLFFKKMTPANLQFNISSFHFITNRNPHQKRLLFLDLFLFFLINLIPNFQWLID